MRIQTVTADQAGRRVDRWLMKLLPTISMSMAQKLLRTKCVKRNGKHLKPDDRLEAGDELQLYIPDALFEEKRTDSFLSGFRVRLSVLYEDENFLLADKRPGLAVHGDGQEKVDTLLNHVRAYLYQKGEYDSLASGAFSPALCNRIDRFTGGIVIAAKNEAALKAMDAMIRARQVEKRYLLVAKGRMRPETGMLKHFIRKPEGAKRVQVLDAPEHGAKEALTRYRTLAVRGELSLMECELLTGRTHQIRAQFAHVGRPLLGDGQYGDQNFNRRYQRQGQALYAYAMAFHPPAGDFAYLAQVRVTVPKVSFAEEYFPDFRFPPQ